MAKTRGINLVCESFPDMEVLGYEIRLEQVWVNLLDNAIKFNRPDGEVRVDVVRDPERALVRVCDTGSGIPSATCRAFSNVSIAWIRPARAPPAAPAWAWPSSNTRWNRWAAR